MSEIPENLSYTPEHEWAVLVDDTTVRVGITDYAQNSLGDIVFVSINQADELISSGETFGEVESTKSVSDLYAPVTGKVLRSNDALEASPELVNSDPYGEGWIAELEVADGTEVTGLLDSTGYRALVGE